MTCLGIRWALRDFSEAEAQLRQSRPDQFQWPAQLESQWSQCGNPWEAIELHWRTWPCTPHSWGRGCGMCLGWKYNAVDRSRNFSSRDHGISWRCQGQIETDYILMFKQYLGWQFKGMYVKFWCPCMRLARGFMNDDLLPPNAASGCILFERDFLLLMKWPLVRWYDQNASEPRNSHFDTFQHLFDWLSFLLDTYPSYPGHIPHCFQHISFEI